MCDTPTAAGRHDQQPSAKWCFVCGVENPAGLKIRFFNDGHHRCTAQIALGDEYQSYPGVVHGGILATILDETMGRAILAEGAENIQREIFDERFMFTARMDIRYRRPVPLGETFTARGWIENDRRRTAQASGEIVLTDGSVAVEATATLIDIPKDQVAKMVDDGGDTIGWQVYTD